MTRDDMHSLVTFDASDVPISSLAEMHKCIRKKVLTALWQGKPVDLVCDGKVLAHFEPPAGRRYVGEFLGFKIIEDPAVPEGELHVRGGEFGRDLLGKWGL